MRNRLKLILLSALAFILAVIGFSFTNTAQAAVIPVTGSDAASALINQGNFNSSTQIEDWETVHVGYNWSIPDGVQINAGDTATFTLPSNVAPIADLSFDVLDSEGNVIGTFAIAKGSQTGTLTFKTIPTDISNRHGTLGFSANGTYHNTENPNDFILNKYGWVSNQYMGSNTSPATTGVTTLSGETASGEETPTRLTWNVAFNSTGKTMTNVTLTDTLGPNQTFVPGSVYAETGYYLNGSFVATGTISPSSVTVNGNQIIMKFPEVTSIVNLTYQVDVSNVDPNTINTWHNDVLLQSDQVSSEASHDITWGGNGTGTGDQNGSVILTKTNTANGQPIPGAVFELLDSQGNVVQQNLNTDENGQIQINGLAPGDYVLVETGVPDGFQTSNNIEYPFTVVAGQTAKISATNTPDPVLPNTGTVDLVKTDAETGMTLAGAMYNLLDANKNVISTQLVTNSDGMLSLPGLEPGTYYLDEISAPTGYEINSEPIEFTITTGETTTVNAKDVKTGSPVPPVITPPTTEPPVVEPGTGTAQIMKIDALTNQPLANAVFDLYDLKDNLLQSGLTTNELGILSIVDLQPGTYKLVETTAPEGYQLNSDPIQFTIDSNETTTIYVRDSQYGDPGVPPTIEEPEPPTEPGTTEPGVTEPGTTEPGTTEPGVTEPGTTEPGTTEPGTTNPAAPEPEIPSVPTPGESNQSNNNAGGSSAVNPGATIPAGKPSTGSASSTGQASGTGINKGTGLGVFPQTGNVVSIGAIIAGIVLGLFAILRTISLRRRKN
ncbi:SpaA isopeptide-forming pilin-related protein [Companilactobacillus sp.]|uniref:SpaA isopeptide-forming pilin-related protein n=1 Tax=Companilactobacillus sp. TaxID=2767905 RepID=UPI002625B091|nr:SpaA isopeptide-forming pilin-related protein [Companilactobacillus sp.]